MRLAVLMLGAVRRHRGVGLRHWASTAAGSAVLVHPAGSTVVVQRLQCWCGAAVSGWVWGLQWGCCVYISAGGLTQACAAE